MDKNAKILAILEIMKINMKMKMGFVLKTAQNLKQVIFTIKRTNFNV
jgi:hypothetical protein